MKRSWSDAELNERWSLTRDENEFAADGTASNRAGLAVLLKFFRHENRFPQHRREIPAVVIEFVAEQLKLSPRHFAEYDLTGRTAERHRAQIRSFTEWRPGTKQDGKRLIEWLLNEVLPKVGDPQQIETKAIAWYREQRIENPAARHLDRLVRAAVRTHETEFFQNICQKLSDTTKRLIDELLEPAPVVAETNMQAPGGNSAITSLTPTLNDLKADPGRPGLDSLFREIGKLTRINKIDLPSNLFDSVSAKSLDLYRQRASTEPPSELRLRVESIRYTLVAAYCWQRRREIIDGLVELLIQIVHRIGVRAEHKVEQELLNDFRKVRGKNRLLFQMAEAALEHPEGVIEEVLYPIVGKQTLRDLVKEYKAAGPAFRQVVHTVMRASYSTHYRRMLPVILDALVFRSNNAAHRPVIEALALLKRYRDSTVQYFPPQETVPIDGVVSPKWEEIALEEDEEGNERINRINYEICVLQSLRDGLRSKEIWVEGANRFRNPDEDLPGDFINRRDDYYEALDLTVDSAPFIEGLHKEMQAALQTLNDGMAKNSGVRITERGDHRLSVSPLEPQEEPKNLAALKAEIVRRWPATSLLDVLKETELRIGFTDVFKSAASREVIDPAVLQRRLLLCLYGLGTNTGMKGVLTGDTDITYKELLYVRRRFVQKDLLRNAIARVVNATFAARRTEIWGEGTSACASDSKKFGAWDQNLMTEWHIRYGGRGVMIYWHVERKASCIYSQLKRCSSSEVAAMIEGVLRHCTDMEVEKNYVDSHGQSEVGFAFCRLLGFDLLPRLKAIYAQKLYLPTAADEERYPILEPILTRAVNWELIAQQYDEMIKFATALRLGTAESEAILRRFTRSNVQHPTYAALAELGKVVKTIFLCRYLHSMELRREIHEGLNVVENWNSANAFIFYGKSGEVASNQLEEQELSILSLHLLQSCLVYVNTLMIQRVLSEKPWLKRMKAVDLRALTPLVYGHVNPYGRFELDMTTHLPIDEAT